MLQMVMDVKNCDGFSELAMLLLTCFKTFGVKTLSAVMMTEWNLVSGGNFCHSQLLFCTKSEFWGIHNLNGLDSGVYLRLPTPNNPVTKRQRGINT